MAYRIGAGGMLDVSPDIQYNINAHTMLGQYEYLGNETDPGRHAPYGSGVSRPLGQFGGWIKVPDESVKIHRPYGGIAGDRIVWSLPNGTSIQVEQSEYQGSVNSFQWPFAFIVSVSNVYLKVTPNTYPGMLAMGLLPPEYTPPPVPPPDRDLDDNIASSLSSLVWIVGIGALIYFVPRKTFAKLGLK